ncbi:hypothetical protein ACHQM5_018790 [Ranunculus cassubicifolius]
MERRNTLRSSGKLSNLTMESILNQATIQKPTTNPLRKKPKFKEAIIGENDRISNLPEPILDHILSFLDMSQVVQTSILSNTWRNIWKTMSLTSVQFDYDTFCSITKRCPEKDVNHEKFLDSVRRVLKKRQPVGLHCFRFSHDSRGGDYTFCSRMWKLFNLLVHCRVQHLDLELPLVCPSRIFTYKYLTVLKLNRGMEHFYSSHLSNSMWLPSLKTLHFVSVVFREATDFFEKFISNCPLLSKLIITDCRIERDEHVTISSALLQHFEINYIYGYHFILIDNTICKVRKPCKITICTPNLVSFKCKSMIANKYSFGNLSALRDADIEMELFRISHLTMQQKKEFGTEMVKLLGGLCNAESITVSGWVLEVIAQDIEVFVTPFHALRHLKMRTWLSRDTIKAIHCLLHHTDKVETLSMEIIEPKVDLGIEKPVFFSEYKFHHLRVLKIKGIQGAEEEVEFLKGVLKSAINLEELIVVKRKYPLAGSEKQLEYMRETLLALPREFSIIKIQLL